MVYKRAIVAMGGETADNGLRSLVHNFLKKQSWSCCRIYDNVWLLDCLSPSQSLKEVHTEITRAVPVQEIMVFSTEGQKEFSGAVRDDHWEWFQGHWGRR